MAGKMDGRRGGDKWPEYHADIGWTGRLVLGALVLLVLAGAFGWLLI